MVAKGGFTLFNDDPTSHVSLLEYLWLFLFLQAVSEITPCGLYSLPPLTSPPFNLSV